MINLGVSIVVYKDLMNTLNIIETLAQLDFVRVSVVDNSPNINNQLAVNPKIEYTHNPSNPGFGAAHNLSIRNTIHTGLEYHLIINPDISFESLIVSSLMKFMEANPTIGAAMPKVIYPDGKIQRLAKLIPTPLNYFMRRFVPISIVKNWINNSYELTKYDYTYTLDAPFLSGCFLMMRTDVLKKFGGFDEQFFMYFEDNDLCRNVLKSGFRCTVFPSIQVIHDHTPKKFSKWSTIKMYFSSAFIYFNKWGWFFDEHRREINKKVLCKIMEH